MAYVATQLTKPIRIIATMFLTPIVARVLRRRREGAAEAEAEGTPEEASTESAAEPSAPGSSE